MKTAKFVNYTFVRGVHLVRCECINCKERWNRSFKNQGRPTTCKKCKTDQWIPRGNKQ